MTGKHRREGEYYNRCQRMENEKVGNLFIIFKYLYSIELMRRKNIKIRQFQLNGAKLNSIFIARRLGDYFATGDTLNNVTLYTFSAQQPLINFTSNTNANIQSEVSAVAISWEEDIIFSGSNRGIINIWDINSGKNSPVYTLKGHATAVNCFGIFPDDPDRLASGSYDTHIKLWDIRNKNNTGMLKHHTKQINSIDVSPDNRYLLSGSQDSTSKLWDLRYPEKLVATYSEHSAPVLKVKFNPQDCMFASCSMDKTSKYFRCEANHYNYMSSTQLVSMPITAIDFSPDGKQLCTAGNDILKIWNMNKNGVLLETIESAWRGVQDIMWTQKGLLGLSSTSSALSVWYCDIEKRLKKNPSSEVRIENQSKLPKIFRNSQERFEEEVNNESLPFYEKIPKNIDREKQLEDVLKNVNYALDIVNDIDEKKNIKQVEDKEEKQFEKQIQEEKRQRLRIEKEKQQKEREIQQRERSREQREREKEQREKERQQRERDRQEREQKQRERRQRIQREKEEEEMRRLEEMQKERIERQKILHQRLQETLQRHQNKELDATLQNDVLQNSSVMNISAFLGDGVQKQKLRQIQLIGEIMKDSGKYSSVITTRSNVVKPIIHLWKQGNIEGAMRALSQYSPKEKDVSVISDVVTAILHNSKFKSAITPDAACCLIDKLLQLLQNKHSTYVKAAMYSLNDLALMFKDELIKVKMFNPMTRVDFSREERLAKYDRLADRFLTTFKQDRVRKYSSAQNKSNEQLNRIAKQLYTNLEQILRKIMPKNQPQPA